MRRLLVILLLLILPFQATLAAVDLCCSYDRGVRHQPCASEPAAQPATAKVADGSAVDIHCALCFLASVGLMSAPAALALPIRIDRLVAAHAAPPTWSSLASPALNARNGAPPPDPARDTLIFTRPLFGPPQHR